MIHNILGLLFRIYLETDNASIFLTFYSKPTNYVADTAAGQEEAGESPPAHRRCRSPAATARAAGCFLKDPTAIPSRLLPSALQGECTYVPASSSQEKRSAAGRGLPVRGSAGRDPLFSWLAFGCYAGSPQRRRLFLTLEFQAGLPRVRPPPTTVCCAW